MRKKLVPFILTAVLFVPFYVSVAEETEVVEETTRKTTIQDKRAERETMLEEKKANIEERTTARLEKKCELVQNRLQNKTKQMVNNLNMYKKVHQRTVERLTRLEQMLKSKGLDTSNLVSQIAVLSEKTLALQNTYNQSISKVETAGTASCEESKEAFKNRFELAKTDVEKIKSLRAEIRTYINDTIKPELQKLRQQLEDENQETEEDSEVETETEESNQ